VEPAYRPDVLDETVIHDPSGRPWLICTLDLRAGSDEDDDGPFEDPPARVGRYETQVHYTARAGIRGLPTGHGQRFVARADAIAGHRRWCLRVRTGDVIPDQVPDDSL
jgi:hypothetical protein